MGQTRYSLKALTSNRLQSTRHLRVAAGLDNRVVSLTDFGSRFQNRSHRLQQRVVGQGSALKGG